MKIPISFVLNSSMYLWQSYQFSAGPLLVNISVSSRGVGVLQILNQYTDTHWDLQLMLQFTKTVSGKARRPHCLQIFREWKDATSHLLHLRQRLRQSEYWDPPPELSEEMGESTGKKPVVSRQKKTEIPGETSKGSKASPAPGSRELWQSYLRRNQREGACQDEPESLWWLQWVFTGVVSVVWKVKYPKVNRKVPYMVFGPPTTSYTSLHEGPWAL